MKQVVIQIETTEELDYNANYMGRCNCGCDKELYKGVTVIIVKDHMIHIDCLEQYLKRNLVVL